MSEKTISDVHRLSVSVSQNVHSFSFPVSQNVFISFHSFPIRKHKVQAEVDRKSTFSKLLIIPYYQQQTTMPCALVYRDCFHLKTNLKSPFITSSLCDLNAKVRLSESPYGTREKIEGMACLLPNNTSYL